MCMLSDQGCASIVQLWSINPWLPQGAINIPLLGLHMEATKQIFRSDLYNFRIEIQWALESAATTLHWQQFLNHFLNWNSMNEALASVRCSFLWPVYIDIAFWLCQAAVLGSLYDQNIMNVALASVRCTQFWHILVKKKLVFTAPGSKKRALSQTPFLLLLGFAGPNLSASEDFQSQVTM